MKNLKFYLLVCVAVIFFSLQALIAQTIDKYALDGALYFKFKDNVPMNFSVKAGKVLPENIPFLSKLKDKYGITSVRNTIWQTTES
ncbi:MAG: hypothetical protein ACUVQP_08315, partial [Bacteroidales bacterium]